MKTCHAWVVLILGNEDIYIESTSGKILDKKYYAKNYPLKHKIIIDSREHND